MIAGLVISLAALLLVVNSSCGAYTTILAAATPTLPPALMDHSWLTDNPCAAPCWYGLELGRSTKAEALQVVRGLSFLDSASMTETPDSYWEVATQQLITATSVSLRCRQPDEVCARLVFVNDTLKEIGIYPNFMVSLSDVVAHFGKPDRMSVTPHFSELFPPDACDLALVWLQRRLWVPSRNVSIHGACETVKQGKGLDPHLQANKIYFDLPSDINMSGWESGRDYAWSGFATP